MIDCINCQEFSHDSAFLKTPSQYTYVIYYRYPNHLLCRHHIAIYQPGKLVYQKKKKKKFKKMARPLFGTRLIFFTRAKRSRVTRCQSDSPGFDVDRESKQGPPDSCPLIKPH